MRVCTGIVKGLGRSASAAAALAVVAGTAWAELPAVLDFVPPDAAVVITAPSVQGLLNDVAAFNKAFGAALPPDLRGGLAQIQIAQFLTAQPGFDAAGSAAVVLTADALASMQDGTFDEARPPVVALLPISDFKAFQEGPFIAGQAPTTENGVMTLSMPDGTQIHMRDLGGFVAAGVDGEALRAFDGAKGRMAAHSARMGASGDRLASANDVAVIANIPALAPMLEQGVADLGQQAEFLAAMSGQPGAKDQLGAFTTAAQNFVRDGEVGLVGLNIGGEGVAMDLGAHFKEGSELSGLFAQPGSTEGLVEKLPGMGYIAAFAFDMRSPLLARIVNTGMVGENALPGLTMPADLFEKTSGYAGVIGAAPAMGAGLFSNSIGFAATDDPAALRAGFAEAYTKLNGTSAAGLTIASAYESGVNLEQHGLTVDTYSMKMTPDAAAAEAGAGALPVDPAMIMPMLFGAAGGPNGYIASGNGGVYSTMTKNGQLLKQALSAGGEVQSLAKDERISRVHGKMLDHGLAGEAFVSVDGTLGMVMPMLMMFGAVTEPIEVPPMDPIGLSLSSGEGGMATRVFVPGEVIAFLTDLGQKMNGGIEPGMGGQEQDDKPRF